MAETRLDRAAAQEQQSDILARRTEGATGEGRDVLDYLLAKQQEAEAARGQRASFGDQLTNPAGIVTGIASLLAAAFGGAEGAQAAAGATSGYLQGAAQNVQNEQARLDQDAKAKQEELADARNALNLVYQANPESFLDETGNMMVDPAVLGYAMTGLPISIDPSTRLKRRERTDAKDAQLDAAFQAFARATDNDGRREAMGIWNRVGGFEWTDSEMDTMAGADSLQGFMQNMLPYADLGSLLDAMLQVETLEITDMSDERLRPIFQGIAARSAGAGGHVPEKWETAGTLITSWVLEDYPVRSTLTPLEQAEGALASEPDLLIAYQKQYEDQLYDGSSLTLKEYTKLYTDMVAKAASQSGGIEAMLKIIPLDRYVELTRNSINKSVNDHQLMTDVDTATPVLDLVEYAQTYGTAWAGLTKEQTEAVWAEAGRLVKLTDKTPDQLQAAIAEFVDSMKMQPEE